MAHLAITFQAIGNMAATVTLVTVIAVTIDSND